MIRIIREGFGFGIVITITAFVISGAYFAISGENRIYGERKIVKDFLLEPMYEENADRKKMEDGQRISFFIKTEKGFQYEELDLNSVKIQWGDEAKYTEEAQMYQIKGKMRNGDNRSFYSENSVQRTLVLPKEEVNKYVLFK